MWVLRIAVAGEFIGHGVFALQGKKAWIDWIHQLTGAEIGTAATLLTLIGFADLFIALIVFEVSESASPFTAALDFSLILITSAESRFPAISNEVRVRVLGS